MTSVLPYVWWLDMLEIFTAVTMKGNISCIVKPCNSDRIRRFGGKTAYGFRFEDETKQAVRRALLVKEKKIKERKKERNIKNEGAEIRGNLYLAK
jgi:hypothetical protein